jgi:hypothetical protein
MLRIQIFREARPEIAAHSVICETVFPDKPQHSSADMTRLKLVRFTTPASLALNVSQLLLFLPLILSF